jgi:hypothetical protein
MNDDAASSKKGAPAGYRCVVWQSHIGVGGVRVQVPSPLQLPRLALASHRRLKATERRSERRQRPAGEAAARQAGRREGKGGPQRRGRDSQTAVACAGCGRPLGSSLKQPGASTPR